MFPTLTFHISCVSDFAILSFSSPHFRQHKKRFSFLFHCTLELVEFEFILLLSIYLYLVHIQTYIWLVESRLLLQQEILVQSFSSSTYFSFSFNTLVKNSTMSLILYMSRLPLCSLHLSHTITCSWVSYSAWQNSQPSFLCTYSENSLSLFGLSLSWLYICCSDILLHIVFILDGSYLVDRKWYI